jgi:hypothetical protein
MVFKIVELSKHEGKVIPDPNLLVAEVKLKNKKVSLEVFNKKHETTLKELFSKPFYRMKESVPTYPGGPILDVPEKIEPWDPEVVKILPEELFLKGLGILVSNAPNK